MVIYLIHTTVNGKYYVGKTVQPIHRRWNCHIRVHEIHEHRSEVG